MNSKEAGHSKKNTTTATRRLKQDYLRLRKDPVPYICAEPLPSNILEWHYVVRGPEKTPYKGGYYHGKLMFPPEFPFKPPSIYMITPNGRFSCNTRLCLSISDYHPDTWNPAWSVSAILTGLLSFMVENIPTLGSIETSDYTKRELSDQSLAYNLKDKVFCELFPDVVEEIKMKQKTQKDMVTQALRVKPKRAQEVGDPALNGHVPKRRAKPRQPRAHHQPNQNLRGTLTTLFVIASIVVFAITFKFALQK
ncbi:ubiquitin-conjugating enzyme E2 J2-like [Xyrauchen texanus]|uniref:ubiquitin-conjugating enzyme E2 J2-like n=1 Tax=Xyrauchen texanus TaxID=154827 RepID=UPI002241C3FF|nr:ubiquitin-conjugating enzyme E2 J2-like [Xyrauchen texanus]